MQRSRFEGLRAHCAQVLLAALLAPACIVLHRAGLPMPAAPTNAPPAAVIDFQVQEIRLLHGAEPATRPVGFEQSVGSRELANVLERWQRRGWIRGWGRPKRTPVPATHRLTLAGTHREEYSVRWEAVTGATLGLVPALHRIHYEWTFTLQDLQTGQSYAVPVRRTQSTWFQLLLLPLSPISLLGVWAGDRYQADYLYRELSRRGAWSTTAASQRSPR